MNTPVKLSWVMTSYNNYEAKHEGYIITVNSASYYIFWTITKKGEIVDNYIYHTPTTDTASAKIQSEKALNKIIMNTVYVKRVDKEEVFKHWGLYPLPKAVFYDHPLGVGSCYITCDPKGSIDWEEGGIYTLEELIKINNVEII